MEQPVYKVEIIKSDIPQIQITPVAKRNVEEQGRASILSPVLLQLLRSPLYKDWLVPDDDPNMAKCKLCGDNSYIMDEDILKDHMRSRRHMRNMKSTRPGATCRTCLSQFAPQDLTSLFTLEPRKCCSYNDILYSVTGIQVVKYDTMPAYICQDCKSKALQAYNFQLRAQRADAFLQACTINEATEIRDNHKLCEVDTPATEADESPPELSTKKENEETVIDLAMSDDSIADPDYTGLEHSDSDSENSAKKIPVSRSNDSVNVPCAAPDSNKRVELGLRKCLMCNRTCASVKMLLQHIRYCKRNVKKESDVEPVSKTSIRKEPVPKTSIRKESVPKTSIRKEPVPKTSIRKEPVLKTSIRKESVPKTSIRKEPVPKTSIRKEPVPKTSIRKEPVLKTSIKKEPVPKTSIIKEPIPKTKVSKCGLCYKSFGNVLALLNHVRTMHRLKTAVKMPKTKPKLPSKPSKKSLKVSERKMKAVDTPALRCGVCSSLFQTEQELDTHCRKHGSTEVIMCGVCERVYLKYSQFKRHFNVHHPEMESIVKAETTETVLEVKDSEAMQQILQYVRMTNIGDLITSNIPPSDEPMEIEAYVQVCGLCGCVILSPEDLQVHNKTEHPDFDKRCYYCAETYTDKGLKQHKKICQKKEKKYECVMCGMRFIIETSLVKHMAVKHLNMFFERWIEYKKHLPRHACNKCNKTFALEKQLKNHISTCDPDQVFICDVCNKLFHKKFYLQRHLRVVHDENRNKYLCSACGKGFPVVYDMIKHMRTHTRDFPYKCTLCPKEFATAHAFKYHMRRHTGDSPHVCNECGSRFIRAQSLRNHMLIHTGERPFSCDICLHAFRQPYDLVKHRAKIHGAYLKTMTSAVSTETPCTENEPNDTNSSLTLKTVKAEMELTDPFPYKRVKAEMGLTDSSASKRVKAEMGLTDSSTSKRVKAEMGLTDSYSSPSKRVKAEMGLTDSYSSPSKRVKAEMGLTHSSPSKRVKTGMEFTSPSAAPTRASNSAGTGVYAHKDKYRKPTPKLRSLPIL